MVYNVDVKDYYGNPTGIPRPRFIDMQVIPLNNVIETRRIDHRPRRFYRVKAGRYRVRVQEKYRGDYKLVSSLSCFNFLMI